MMKPFIEKLKRLALILSLTIVGIYLLGAVILRFFDIKDVAEVYPYVQHFEPVFRSERFWADGRFDIFEFSLEEKAELEHFEPMDGFGKYIYRSSIKGWVNGYYNEGSLSLEIANGYEEVMKQSDVKYLYVSKGLDLQRDEKFFIYSPALNRGYLVAK